MLIDSCIRSFAVQGLESAAHSARRLDCKEPRLWKPTVSVLLETVLLPLLSDYGSRSIEFLCSSETV